MKSKQTDFKLFENTSSQKTGPAGKVTYIKKFDIIVNSFGLGAFLNLRTRVTHPVRAKMLL